MIENINVGTYPNDHTGDTLRNAMIKINSNFEELVATGVLVEEDIVALQSNISNLQTQINGKAPIVHTHVISQINGLQAALNGKVSTSTYITDMMAINSSIQAINDALNEITDILTQLEQDKVPYTGATRDVDLGAHSLKTDSLEVSTTSTEIIDAGKIVWNSADGTFNMGLLNGVTLQAGQEMHMYAKASGVIANGDAVQFAGAQGDHLLIKKAVPSEINANPEYFVGVATQDFTNNQFGYVTVFGQVRDLDTDSYLEGTVLYYQSSGSTTGLLTDVRPTGPNAKITVAAVVRSHQNQGAIFVRPHVMPMLGALQDVEISGATQGDILTYNSSTQVWENRVNNSIQKSVGPTYTTNSVLTVTQAEYDAIVTKDPTTLYFIV